MRRILMLCGAAALALSGLATASLAAEQGQLAPAQTTTGATTGTTGTTATTATTSAQAPTNTAPPTLSGQAVEGQTLTANTGSWSGTQPITFTYQWQRCDQSGLNCANIPGATSPTYTLTAADVGRTIRVAVTGQNAAGSSTAFSAPTAPVQAAGPAGQIRLPSGEISVPITSVSLPARLIIERVVFLPNPVRSRTRPIRIRVRIKDTRGFVIRGALVYARATPLVSTPTAQVPTAQDGWATLTTVPRRARGIIFPLQRGLNVQYYVQARKQGERLGYGVDASRLVQVATAPPR